MFVGGHGKHLDHAIGELEQVARLVAKPAIPRLGP